MSQSATGPSEKDSLVGDESTSFHLRAQCTLAQCVKMYVLCAMTMIMVRSPGQKWRRCGSSAIAGACTRAADADTCTRGCRALAARRALTLGGP